MDPRARRAAVFGSAYAALSLAELPLRLDSSAATYSVLATSGGGKIHAAAHPLYLPLLRATEALSRLLGWRGPASVPAEAVSALAGGVAAGLLLRLAERLSGDRRAALAATCLFVFCGHVWAYGLQSKPYALASAFAAAFLLVATAPGLMTPGRGALAGTCAGLALGFDAMSFALIPAVWMWAVLRPRTRRAGYLWTLHAVFAAFALAYMAALPRGPLATLHAMYRPAGVLDSLWAGAVWTAQGRNYLDWTWSHVWDLLTPLPLLALVFVGGRPIDRARRRGAFALFAALWAARAVAGGVFHAKDDFVHAAWLLWPCALAAAARRRGPPTVALALAAAVGAVGGFMLRIRPLADPSRSPQRREADFLARGLGPQGLLAAAGQPDWGLLDALNGRVAILRLDGNADALAPLSARVDGAAVQRTLAAVHAGRRVWLAGDSLYRPEDVVGHADIDAFQDAAVRRLLRFSFLGAPIWSPRGQRYLPLLARAPRRKLRAPAPPPAPDGDPGRIYVP